MTPERLNGWWSVEGDDLSPDLVEQVQTILPEAAAQGSQVVVADGVTLRWHPIEPLDHGRLVAALLSIHSWPLSTAVSEANDIEREYSAAKP